MNSKPTQKRKKKYERCPEVAFQIQERDFEILKLLYQYRFLNSQQIKMMIGFDTKNIQNRLNKMFHAGLPLCQDRCRLN